MTNQVIPDAAIEAAHKAWRGQAALDGSIFEYNLRAALEAAAPHMLAGAYTDGYCDGMSGEQHKVDQYRATP